MICGVSLASEVWAQVRRARKANLDRQRSRLFTTQALENPEALAQLLLDARVGLEGLEALVADELHVTETCGSLEDLERELKVTVRRRDLVGVIFSLWPQRQRPAPFMPVSSVFYVQLLDGSLLCRCMTVSSPAISLELDDWTTLLWTMRRIHWLPERKSLFPVRFRRWLCFLSWVGGQLGVQPIWDHYVLPFVPVVDDIVPPACKTHSQKVEARVPPEGRAEVDVIGPLHVRPRAIYG